MAWFMQKIYIEYLNTVKLIFMYVMGMKDLAFKYSKFLVFILLVYSDYDYGGDRHDIKSTFACVFNIDQVLSLRHPRSNLLLLSLP